MPQAAGATGVILDSEVSVFEAGIAGNATIPGAQFTKAYSDTLRPAAEAGTLNVTLDPALVGTTASVESGLGDTLNSSSSRGVHGSEGIVKPDVAAPGTLIGSVGVGTGNGPGRHVRNLHGDPARRGHRRTGGRQRRLHRTSRSSRS